MIKNKLRINLFFFLNLIFHWNSYALDPPSVKARPEIKVYAVNTEKPSKIRTRDYLMN